MHTLLQPLFLILLFVLIRAGDIAISAATVRDVVRFVCYGLPAVLALIAVIISLTGL